MFAGSITDKDASAVAARLVYATALPQLGKAPAFPGERFIDPQCGFKPQWQYVSCDDTRTCFPQLSWDAVLAITFVRLGLGKDSRDNI